jgi:hypothetical protein
MVDYPDGTLPITITVNAEILSQIRQLPWWVRYSPKRVLILDDFEGTLKWEAQDGYIEKATTNNTLEGTYFLHLYTDAVADAGGEARRILGYSGRSKYMLQLMWNSPDIATSEPNYIDFMLRLYTGSQSLTAILRYVPILSPTSGKWQYLASDGTYTDITDGTQMCIWNGLGLNYLRIDVDFTEGVNEYIKLISNDVEYDLSELALFVETDTTDPMIELGMNVQTRLDAQGGVGIDALVLSDNEE